MADDPNVPKNSEEQIGQVEDEDMVGTGDEEFEDVDEIEDEGAEGNQGVEEE
jgi:hypothetical protein